MNSRRRIRTILLALAALTSSCQASISEREKGWRSDIDFLMKEIQRQHYIYKSQPLPSALVQAATKLKAEIPRFSDERMLVELQRLMVFLGDGHCYVLPFGAQRIASKVLPLRFYLFSDGLYVIDAEGEHERWIGSRVLKFANTPVEAALAQMSDLISRDNDMGIKWIGPLFLRFRGGLETVVPDLNSQNILVTLEDRNRQKTATTFTPIAAPPMRGVPKLISSKLSGAPPAPLYLENVARLYWIKELSDNKTVYVQFNQAMNDAQETLASFAGRLQRILEEKLPAKLIIDVRHNNGGNADLLGPLIEVLSRFEKRDPSNMLFVLTGRNTFSAAQIFISRVDHLANAIFAGEPSSSKPNFVGEENGVVLPWSGAICSISNRYHESIPHDLRHWIEPEIKIELSSQDYFANRDPVLEAALNK